MNFDWITETLERLAPELPTISNQPPLTAFERLQLEMTRDGIELLALIADGSTVRGANQARIDELKAKWGFADPMSCTARGIRRTPNLPEEETSA